MKILKLLSLVLATVAFTFLSSCGEDEIPVSRVNFTEVSYDVDPVTLDDVTVILSLNPVAAGATTIGIDFTGGAGAFTTIPALSGSSLEIPVAAGDQSVSFTVSFVRANFPEENLVIEMGFGALGPNVGTGITISSVINVPVINLQTIPYAEAFGGEDVTSCNEITFPPAGWTVETVVGDPNGNGTWRCIGGADGVFTHTGTGLEANAFLTGETIDAWLISPVLGPITSSTSMDVGLDIRFDPNGGFPYDVEVLISKNFNGVNVGSATWETFTDATDAWLANDFAVNDVTIYNFDLSAYAGEAISIAFRYLCPDNGNCGVARFDDFSISN